MLLNGNILDLVRLLLNLPFSNGKLEHIFSILKLIKADKRSSISDEALDDLLSLNINPMTTSVEQLRFTRIVTQSTQLKQFQLATLPSHLVNQLTWKRCVSTKIGAANNKLFLATLSMST